jgi:hypothetical protein
VTDVCDNPKDVLSFFCRRIADRGRGERGGVPRLTLFDFDGLLAGQVEIKGASFWGFVPKSLKSLDCWKKSVWIFLPFSWIFLPQGFGFPSPDLEIISAAPGMMATLPS